MKKLGMLITIFSIFVLASSGLASTADILQPAATITHNEDLVVNGMGTFNSLRVGREEEGGVTFFNGTIVNSTTTEGEDNPITFGDNVRIDGSLFRTEIGGDNALRVADTILPAATNLNDLGSSDLRFKDAYLSGNINIAGDINQSLGSKGAIKAMVRTNSDYEGRGSGCVYYWTFDNSEVTCTYSDDSFGTWSDITFEFSIKKRFWLSSEFGGYGSNITSPPTTDRISLGKGTDILIVF